MSSNLRVNNILPSVGTNVAIGTAGGSVTLTGAVSGAELSVSGGINVTGVSTFASLNVTGNVSIAGTLTYEDVTNIDSIGIVTARNGITVSAGGINATGVITATSFSGSGSGLTGIVNSGITTVAAGTTSAPSISPSGDSNTGIFFPSADTIAFGEGGAEAARFDSNGKLLVGTSTQTGIDLLTVEGHATDGNSAAFMMLRRGTTNPSGGLGYLRFGDASNSVGAQIDAQTDGTWASGDYPGRLSFSVTAAGASSPTEAMRIDQAQRVAIGSAGGGRKFNVQSQNAAAFFSAPSNGSCPDMITIQCGTNAGDTTTRYINFRRQNGAIIGYVGMNGASAVNYSTSSDYRLKENVTPVSDGITRLQQLKPSRFNFIADPAKTVDGFLAHEVQTIVPEAITGEKDAVDDEGNPEYQGIDQSKLVPLLTAALQEAVAKIESLEVRLTAAGI
jgi:hypothetical protein